MQPARTTHLIKILAQTHKTLVDHAAIGLDLGFTRTAKKAEAATLALQMGPEPDKTRSLVFQMGKLDLQYAFARRSTGTEDIENEARTVENLAVHRLFEIALLAWRELGIDDHDLHVVLFHHLGKLLDLPLAKQGGRAHGPDGKHSLPDNHKADRRGEPDSLFQTGFRSAELVIRCRALPWENNRGACRGRCRTGGY